MNNDFQGIIANDELCSYFATAIKSGSLSHAYILHGARGTGKHTLSYLLAAAINCENKSESDKSIPCCKCNSCKKILGKISPDVNLVSREDDRATLGIAPIRKIREDVTFFPIDGAYKVYIIEDADKMTVQAQNAFLLSLEEPPEYVLFFLLCESSADLLETVRSRAPTLRTERLDRSMVEAHLLENEKRARTLRDESPDEWREILAISSGCIGYALELLDSKKRKSVLEGRKNAERLISLLRSSDMAAAFETISALGTKRAEVLTSLSSLQQALRDLIVLKKCDSAPLCFFADPEKAAEQATYFTAPALFSLYDACVSAIDELERNANVRLCLMNMMQSAGLI
jgi:DNA polymerase-3 subunit delta'